MFRYFEKVKLMLNDSWMNPRNLLQLLNGTGLAYLDKPLKGMSLAKGLYPFQ